MSIRSGARRCSRCSALAPLAVALAAACTSNRQPAEPARTSAPSAASAQPVSAQPVSAQPATSTTDSGADATNDAPTLPPPAAAPGRGWQCFAWLDHRRWGQNCYRSRESCDRERSAWTHGNVTACEAHGAAYCLRVKLDAKDETRCFGELEYCTAEQHRARSESQAYSECALAD